MFKIIGALMIISAFLLMGYFKIAELKGRQRIMELMRKSLVTLRSEIALRQLTLSDAFKSSGELHENLYFIECGENIASLGAAEAYRRAAEKAASDNHLSNDEKEALLTLSDGLGQKNLSGQLSQLDFTAALVEKCVSDIKREANERAKLIINAAAFIGAATVIILI